MKLGSFFDLECYTPFIDGEFCPNRGQGKPHISPVLQKPWTQLAFASKEEIDRALASSEKGMRAFKELSSYERATILHKMAELLRSHKGEIGKIITLEMGKSIRDAKAEVEYAANYFDWFAEEAKRIYGYTVPSNTTGKQLLVRHEPVGTVVVITPWNFPIAMCARKIGPAIAAGCSTIARPSTDTAVSMLVIAAISKEAGLPAGCLQVVPGDPNAISAQLLSDFRVRKLTFTGSTEVGEKLYGQCVSTFKKVTLELGGHAPLLVFADADIERAAEETINAKLRISGQTCVCANRIFVHHTILEPFVQKLYEKVTKLKIGNPLDETTDLTNVLHPSSLTKIPLQVEDALQKGAKCILKGNAPHEPTILTHITKEMEIFTKETFGPVFPICSFATEEEVLQAANDTEYGLAAYVFTQDFNRAMRVTAALEYGIIGLNDGLPTSPQLPFGGVKCSGFGREGGRSGIYEYLTEKSISMNFY